MKNKMYLDLGDSLKVYHCVSERILFSVNHTVEEVQQAYKDSCKLTGISFNFYSRKSSENYISKDRNYKESRKYMIATNISSTYLSDEVIEIMRNFNYKFKNTNIKLDRKYLIDVWWWFISLSLKDLVFEESVEDNFPSINSDTNSNLTVNIGYGIYDIQ